jgi:hypothetical protein
MITTLRQQLEAVRDDAVAKLEALGALEEAWDRLAVVFGLPASAPAPSTGRQCARAGCERRFPADGRRRFCSASCRTQAYQQRKAQDGEVSRWRDKAIQDGLIAPNGRGGDDA